MVKLSFVVNLVWFTFSFIFGSAVLAAAKSEAARFGTIVRRSDVSHESSLSIAFFTNLFVTNILEGGRERHTYQRGGSSM